MSAARHLLPHDDSSALGSDSTWDSTGSTRRTSSPAAPSKRDDADYLPVQDGGPLPILVYLATDFRPGPVDNGQISLRVAIKSAAMMGIRVVRWQPGPGRLDGSATFIDALNKETPLGPADLDALRNWPGGITFIASWPGNEEVVEAAEIVFTGVNGEPRIVRDTANAQVHMHDRVAGYGSGLKYAARKRK